MYQKIDKLTNSIVNRLSGDSFNTDVVKLTKEDISKLKKGWKFDWEKELQNGIVYKLVITHYPDVIQGLISVIDKNDHIFMNLVETAPHNYGKNKIYEGVLGNLVAFACKHSFDLGYEGYVAFEPKTQLIEHYKKTLNAKILTYRTMVIEHKEAKVLIEKYFNN